MCEVAPVSAGQVEGDALQMDSLDRKTVSSAPSSDSTLELEASSSGWATRPCALEAGFRTDLVLNRDGD